MKRFPIGSLVVRTSIRNGSNLTNPGFICRVEGYSARQSNRMRVQMVGVTSLQEIEELHNLHGGDCYVTAEEAALRIERPDSYPISVEIHHFRPYGGDSESIIPNPM